MDIGIIDYSANSGRSFLHRTLPIYKLIFVVFVLTSIIITGNLTVLLSIYLALMALTVLTKLPVIRIISIAAYPAIFALLFAIWSWNGNWTTSGVIVFKALDAALLMVLLIVTTPYPSVFASISPLLPKIVAEGLFLTYRSLFILLELMDNLIRALKIRGGLSPRAYVKNVSNFSSGIGLLLVKGFDISEKFYGIMRIRGYNGKIAGDNKRSFDLRDLIPVAIGALIFLACLGAKYSDNFREYGFCALFVSVVAVIVSVYFKFAGGQEWRR